MTVEDVDALLSARSENEHLEFKAAENSYDFEKLLDYCVALANEGGGRIILGISDKRPRQVTGTKAFSVPEKTVSGVFQRINLRISFEEVLHSSGRVLIFYIPSRPLGQPLDNDGRYLMRVGEDLVPMSADILKKILDEGNTGWELRAAKTGCSDDEIVRILDTQSYFDLLHIPYPATRATVLDKFKSEHLIERAGALWTVTNLGAILFAKQLKDFDTLSRKAPRVIVYEGKSKITTKMDSLGAKGYAIGFQGLVGFINSLVPTNEVIGQALRREAKMFPEIAIRELVANALVHQDLEQTGASVMIEIYSDRIEISNPGRPSISPDRFIDEYRSRNERLGDLMRRLGICEEKGSGIDKVVNAAEVYQLPAPDFRVADLRTSAVLFGQQGVDAMDKNDRIRACYQHCCLRYVMNEQMTNQSLRERFKLSEDKTATTSQIIAATLDAGKIKPADPNQTSTRYRSYIPFWA